MDMMISQTRWFFLCILMGISVAMIPVQLNAASETLECRLYDSIAMGNDADLNFIHEESGQSLATVRRVAYCLFADGTVADKQYMVAVYAADNGANGLAKGYSIYQFEDGATLTASFSGGWQEGGRYNGSYDILGGTARFEGASGDGTITGIESPWATTDIVDIVLNVETP